MAIGFWKTLSEKLIAETSVFQIWKYRKQSKQSGVSGNFYTMQTTDWINVVAVTPESDMVLIRQFRHGIREFTLEIPGGLVDPGEDPAHAAVRELREETGYTGDEPVLLGTVTPNPAIQTNRCYTYLIQNARRTHDLDLEELEEIEVEFYPAEKVQELLQSGKIHHALVVAGLYWYRLYQEST